MKNVGGGGGGIVLKTTFNFSLLCPRDKESGGEGGKLIYPCPFVRPDIDTWFVRLSPPTVLELQL